MQKSQRKKNPAAGQNVANKSYSSPKNKVMENTSNVKVQTAKDYCTQITWSNGKEIVNNYVCGQKGSILADLKKIQSQKRPFNRREFFTL